MCIHERQLLLKSFLFNNYFYFFTDLSRFHCDIGCSLFLSGDHTLGIYRHDLLIRRTVGNFLLGSDRADDRFQRKFFISCNGHFDYYLNSSPQPFH